LPFLPYFAVCRTPLPFLPCLHDWTDVRVLHLLNHIHFAYFKFSYEQTFGVLQRESRPTGFNAPTCGGPSSGLVCCKSNIVRKNIASNNSTENEFYFQIQFQKQTGNNNNKFPSANLQLSSGFDNNIRNPKRQEELTLQSQIPTNQVGYFYIGMSGWLSKLRAGFPSWWCGFNSRQGEIYPNKIKNHLVCLI